MQNDQLLMITKLAEVTKDIQSQLKELDANQAKIIQILEILKADRK